MPGDSKLIDVESIPFFYKQPYPSRKAPLDNLPVSIENLASCSPYRAWKWGGRWSLWYIAITIPKNRLSSGILDLAPEDFPPWAAATIHPI
jgi:hypothetical protein